MTKTYKKHRQLRLNEINYYWLGEFDYLEDYPTCFICGKDKHLEICHLTPKELGGSDECDNLVLLCKRCHSKAPNIKYKEVMIKYIHETVREYNLLFHMKNSEVKEIIEYVLIINERLDNISDKYTLTNEDFINFVSKQFIENTTFVGGHHDANDTTKVEFFKYLSKDIHLEYKFLKWLNDL